jgi:glycosyltransferase involved in cell wall biosynthesis
VAAYTAGNDPIGEAGCGITVPAGDSEGLAIAMHRIAAMPPEERRRLGAAGGDFVRRNHDYRRLSRRFLDEIERCRFDSRGASS